MDTEIKRCCQLVDLVIGGADDYESVLLRGKSITERNEFNALVSEFQKESRPMRIHQVCVSGPTVLVMFQWVLAFCDRYPDVVASWTEFVAYCKKNQVNVSFGMDRSLIFLMTVFEHMHFQVVAHRQNQAA
ncbi:hypothetical protein D3C87_1527310 [compost metagenome]